MPRGIKERDEPALKFTTFFIPPPVTSKNTSSTFLKSETQSSWARPELLRDARSRPPSPKLDEAGSKKPGSDVIIIHPGSRFLRIGRASDDGPRTIHHVIARKYKTPVPDQPHLSCIPPFLRTDPPKQELEPPPGLPEVPTEYRVTCDSEDPTDRAIGNIRVNLRTRMYHFDKIPVVADGSDQAKLYNQSSKGVEIPPHQDAGVVDWLKPQQEKDILIGDIAFRIADPVKSNYKLRWPMSGGTYNYRDYSSRQEAIADLETLWTLTLRNELGIEPNQFQGLSVILIIPDYPDKVYVQDIVNLLLVGLGFRRVSVQQESLVAAFGASISHGCVVDIGANKTSVACVEDGLVLPETRICLDYGGDDISELYLRLLQRIHFPYREANLGKTFDWTMMEDLKQRSTSLAEEDVVLVDYDATVRRPDKPTMKYAFRTYDEPTVSSMLLFDPSVIDFDTKRRGHSTSEWRPNIVDEMDIFGEPIPTAMQRSTAHLSVEHEATIQAQRTEALNAIVETTTLESSISLPFARDPLQIPSDDTPLPSDDQTEGIPETVSVTAKPPPAPKLLDLGINLPPLNIRYEAGKVPLDLAIYHSIQCSTINPGSANVDRLKKMLACILVVGGTALTPGMLGALDSRLRGLFLANMPGHEELVQIIPAPKSIDPRVLAWKGGSVLSKLESSNELWFYVDEWQSMGMRALRDRTWFL